MPTINSQSEQAERDNALNELKRQRAELAAKLAEKDKAIQAAEDGDFRSRLGDRRRSQMSIAERAETVRRVGVEQYLALDW